MQAQDQAATGQPGTQGHLSRQQAHADALARAEAGISTLAPTLGQRWFPGFHITPQAGWTNDPNGASYFKGRYHLFFQHHPYDSSWGPMHWGHASSEDLVTWRREPIALAPSLPEDADGVWSGSAVEGPDGLLHVFYTGHRWRNGVDASVGNVQVQCHATSADGISFTKLGTVITGPQEMDDFRDPKVWRQGDEWLMVVAASVEGRGEVWLYRSPDLEQWTWDSVVYRDPRPDVFMLECPDLFPLGEHWVLLYGPMSEQKKSGFGNRNGHNTGYVIGDWEPGQEFRPLTEYRQEDLGHSFYAPQTMVAPDGRRLMFGWLGGFVLPMASQADDAWSGQMALPREVTIVEDGDGLRLATQPVAELERLRTESTDLGRVEVGIDQDVVLCTDGQCLEVELDVDLAASSSEQVLLLVHQTGRSAYTSVGYDDLAGRVELDRGLTPVTDRGRRSAPFTGGDRLRMRVFVDKGSVEAFFADGTCSLSSMSFPGDGPRRVALASVGGTIVADRVVVHQLRSIWE